MANLNGRNIFIGDIAAVNFLQKEARSAYHYNGQEAIALQVMKRGESNTVEVASRSQKNPRRNRSKIPAAQYSNRRMMIVYLPRL